MKKNLRALHGMSKPNYKPTLLLKLILLTPTFSFETKMNYIFLFQHDSAEK